MQCECVILLPGCRQNENKTANERKQTTVSFSMFLFLIVEEP